MPHVADTLLVAITIRIIVGWLLPPSGSVPRVCHPHIACPAWRERRPDVGRNATVTQLPHNAHATPGVL